MTRITCPSCETELNNDFRFCPHCGYDLQKPIVCPNLNDLSYLKKDLVRLAWNVRKGHSLEYEIRRVDNKEEMDYNAIGLLNWVPMYIPVQKLY